jgi:hypothetical protein
MFGGGAWRFGTEEGIDELANQRIGGNELRTIEAVRAYVEAQNEYASADRGGDEVLEYAQKILSSTGQHDGLYWPTAPDQAPSPVGRCWQPPSRPTTSAIPTPVTTIAS